MIEFGLVGEKLSHSFSKEIHDSFGIYDYKLIEVDRNHIDSFILKKEYKGLNVTFPYKEVVIKYLDFISDDAKKISAINTIVNVSGKLYGYNTDYIGLKKMIEENDINIKDKNILILGTGGTSKTANAVASDMGAKEIRFATHSEIDSKCVYDEKEFAQIIINTTPVGLYPSVDDTPIDISKFDLQSNNYIVEAVIDVIYNPMMTRLVKEAKEHNIKAINGLSMLYYQALASMCYFKAQKADL